MKVHYAGSYGRANLMVRPGIHEPNVERWFKTETDERGELRRIAWQITVEFREGAAEVDDQLGEYLLGQGLVSAEPVPFTPPPQPAKFAEAFAPPEPRKPPIAVGEPLPAEVRGRMTNRVDVA